MVHNITQKFTIFIAVIFSLLLLSTALTQSSMLRDNNRTNIIAMADGKAERPYVQRALLPVVSNMVAKVTPFFLKQAALDFINDVPTNAFMSEMIRFSRWPALVEIYLTPYDAIRVMVMVLCMFAALLVYALTLRRLAAQLFPGHRFLPECTTLFGLLLAACLADGQFKVYDFPCMALAALGLYYMLQQHWRAYITVFILACFNKETAIFLLPVWGMFMWHRLPRRKWLDLAGMQLLIWLLIEGLLMTIYIHNPGDYLFHMWALLGREMMIFTPTDMAVLAVFGWMIFSRWQDLPLLLKVGCISIVGCAATYLLFGVLHEYRVFFDSLPVVALIGAYTIFAPLTQPTRSQY